MSSGPGRVLAGAAIAAIGAVIVGSAAQEQPTYRSVIPTVPVYATVVDSRGRIVPDLNQTEFSILDNGTPATLSLFSSDPQPFTVVVMLDTSASMTANLDRLMAAAKEFLQRLLPVDRAQVGAFNHTIQLSGTFTSNRDELIAALDTLDIGNPTRLHDGLAASLDALKGVDGRRVILVFTDGEDTASRASFETVRTRARAEQVMVYAVGLTSQYFDGLRAVRSRPSRDLKRLAEETGGGYFELTRTVDLGPAFSRVAEELRSQYLLGFAPRTFDGRTHSLDVRVSRPGLRVRARKSYVAASESP